VFSIRPFEASFRDDIFQFLGQVYNYHNKDDGFFSGLQPAGYKITEKGAEFSFISKKSQWMVTYLTNGKDLKASQAILPVRITSQLPNGKTAAVWEFEGWKQREGGIWLPERCTLTQFFESFDNVPDAGRSNEREVYLLEEARFNIPIHASWFIPQFPEGSQVNDFVSDTVLIITNFDFRADPPPYFYIRKQTSQSIR
jgi:hypothetical protein